MPVAVRGPLGTTLLSNLAANSRVSTSSSPTPALVLRIHQNDSLNSGKPYTYNYCFIIKAATREQPHRRALWEKRRWGGAQSFQARSKGATLPAMNMVTYLEAPQTLSFKSCYPACIRRHDWLKLWPLVIGLNLQPPSPPQGSGVELVTWLVFLVGTALSLKFGAHRESPWWHKIQVWFKRGLLWIGKMLLLLRKFWEF